MLLVGLTIVALFVFFYAEDFHRLQEDVQAYQAGSLLPQLPINTNQGLAE